jgi:hypothetical protein
MLNLKETLIVTAPALATRSSLLSVDFSRFCADYRVDIVNSPLFQMEMANDAIQRRVLRELADWDAIKRKTALTVVCANQDAPDTLELFEELCLALRLRANRIKFAALDAETAISMSEVCHIKNIAKFHFKSVCTPKIAGSMDELVGQLMRYEEEGEFFLVLEPSASHGYLAKKMIARGLRVIRLGYYVMRPIPLVPLKGIDPRGLWMLAMDVESVQPAIAGLRLQGINPAVLKWIGNRPSVGALVKHEMPNAVWVNVPELKPNVVLEAISRY